MHIISETESVGLALIVGLKSSARNEYFERSGLGTYNASNTTVKSLVEKGLLKINKAGSIAISDRNQVKELLSTIKCPDMHKWNLWGINPQYHFKRQE